jgi:hypothetical protein
MLPAATSPFPDSCVAVTPTADAVFDGQFVFVYFPAVVNLNDNSPTFWTINPDLGIVAVTVDTSTSLVLETTAAVPMGDILLTYLGGNALFPADSEIPFCGFSIPVVVT